MRYEVVSIHYLPDYRLKTEQLDLSTHTSIINTTNDVVPYLGQLGRVYIVSPLRVVLLSVLLYECNRQCGDCEVLPSSDTIVTGLAHANRLLPRLAPPGSTHQLD